MGLRVWARIQGPSDGGRREKGGGSGGGGERRRRRGWRRAASSYRGRRRRVGGFPCARGGVRGAEGRHTWPVDWVRVVDFFQREICLRTTRPGPDRPNEAHPGATSASANKRAGRFQVVSRSSLHHAVTSEQGTELSSSETDRKRDTR